MNLDTIFSGANQGLIWAVLALGVFISFRLLDFADLSCEGCFSCGALTTAMLLTNGVHPLFALLVAFLVGCLAGTMTGVLHTKLKIPPIMSGILTMTSLYSVNLMITDSSPTVNIGKSPELYGIVGEIAKSLFGTAARRTYVSLVLGAVIACAIVFILYWFLGTEMGYTIRATGDNERMCRAQGINTDMSKILGLALSNGLVALSGSLLCQYQSSANVTMGVGAIVIALASIIIGEAIFSFAKGFVLKLTGIVVGAVVYRVIIAVIINTGIMPPNNLKLLTALVVIAVLGFPTAAKAIRTAWKRRTKRKEAVHAE